MRLAKIYRTKSFLLVLTLFLLQSSVFIRAQKESAFTPYEKAYYADPTIVNFVRPGLVISVVSANIASDGTITVDYKLSDPNGAPLDRSGVVTPGPISVSFLAAYIPKGQEQYSSYIVRTA